MKNFLIDLIGLSGFIGVCCGVYQLYSLPITLIVGGGLTLAYSVMVARGSR